MVTLTGTVHMKVSVSACKVEVGSGRFSMMCAAGGLGGGGLMFMLEVDESSVLHECRMSVREVSVGV